MVALRQARLVLVLEVGFLEVEDHTDPECSHTEGTGLEENLDPEEGTSLVEAEHHTALVETHLGQGDQAIHHDPNLLVVVDRMEEGIGYVDRMGGQEGQEDLAVVEEEGGQLGIDFGLEVGNLGAGRVVEGENQSMEATDQHWNSHKFSY